MKFLMVFLVIVGLAIPQTVFAGQNLTPLDTFFLDGKTGWSTLKNGKALHIARTSDGGAHWAKAVELGNVFDLNEAHLSFVDAQHGWLLALSSPAASKMGETLFRTEDGGQSWQKMADSRLPSKVADAKLKTQLPWGGFYPDGVRFRNTRDGWIAGEYRGLPNFPLLVTHDGGVTWQFQPFPVPTEFQDGGYGNSRLPIFFAGSQVGVLPVEFHNHNNHKDLEKLVIYVTRDGGATWTRAQQ